MKINHNISASITKAQLLRTENNIAATMERLSSGLKINSAKDDPSGIAISNKMAAQIEGLDQSSQNASNGISVIEIADSALSEITSMIQRMSELSVQAASDTNTYEDRTAIQAEISSLRDEIDRVAKDTEYNTKALLNGTLDTRVYASNISRMLVSDTVSPGIYQIGITQAATQSSVVSSTSTGTIPAGTILINGLEVTIEEGESADVVYEKLREAGEQARINVFETDAPPTVDFDANPTTAGYESSDTAFAYGDVLVFASTEYGSMGTIEITASTPELAAFLGLDTMTQTAGTDMQISLNLDPADSAFSAQATVTTSGNKVTITDIRGFTMDFMMDPGTNTMNGTVMEYMDIEVTSMGRMTLQIGANENQTMDVRIPKISSENLYLDELDVTKVDGGSRGITILADALRSVSEARSKLGAYENRLDHAVSSLDASSEDMSSAISRIKDADMAKEMTDYTKYNVLQQTAVSVLGQANDLPQTVLQLLR
ncbi:MAG: flagellin [Lachnospiraceae bacterium]